MGDVRPIGVHLPLNAFPPPPPPPPPPGGGAELDAWAHPHRARRSALRQPALVDPSDLADDAEGRVEVFTIPALDIASLTSRPQRDSAGWARLVGALSSDIAPVVLAVVLVNLLWIGLVLTH